MNDLGAALPERRNGGSITLGVAVGLRQFIADQLLAKAYVTRAVHERVQLCQDPQTERALVSVASTTCCVCMATRSCRNNDPHEVGQRSLERLFPVFTEDSMVPATLSAESGIGYKRARDIATPAHLKALVAAKPRIQAMIPYAVLAGLLPKQRLETRLAVVIETATSTNLDGLSTTRLYVQKAAQAAEEAWQQTIGWLQGPSVTNPTTSDFGHPSSASRDEDSEDMDLLAPWKSRLSALQAQLSRLTDWIRVRCLTI